MWCDYEIIGAILYPDSERAQKYLINYFLDTLFNVNIDFEGDSEEDDSMDTSRSHEKMFDILGKELLLRILNICLKFESLNEMFTSSIDWKRQLALKQLRV